MQQVLADMLLESTDMEAPLQKVPPPLFQGNDVLGSAVCLKGEDLKTAVVNTQVQNPTKAGSGCVIQTVRHLACDEVLSPLTVSVYAIHCSLCDTVSPGPASSTPLKT